MEVYDQQTKTWIKGSAALAPVIRHGSASLEIGFSPEKAILYKFICILERHGSRRIGANFLGEVDNKSLTWC